MFSVIRAHVRGHKSSCTWAQVHFLLKYFSYILPSSSAYNKAVLLGGRITRIFQPLIK